MLERTHLYHVFQAEPREWRLVRLTQPNRLRATCVGISPDGWSGANDSTYFRFNGAGRGWLRIRLSRSGWPPSRVRVLLGSIATADREPVLGSVRRRVALRLPRNGRKVIWLRTPPAPFAARVVVDRKFIPREVAPEESSDPRVLGAQVDYRFFTKRPARRSP